MTYREGDWFTYCDICGQKYYASETTKLSTYTGRGSLIVCHHDADTIDPGLLPFRPPIEKSLPWVRINHTDTTDGSPLVDPETMTLIYYLAASQDNAILTTSQDDAWINVSVPI